MGAKGAGKTGGRKGGREEGRGVGCWVVCVVCVVLGGKECCNAHVCGIRSVATLMAPYHADCLPACLSPPWHTPRRTRI